MNLICTSWTIISKFISQQWGDFYNDDENSRQRYQRSTRAMECSVKNLRWVDHSVLLSGSQVIMCSLLYGLSVIVSQLDMMQISNWACHRFWLTIWYFVEELHFSHIFFSSFKTRWIMTERLGVKIWSQDWGLCPHTVMVGLTESISLTTRAFPVGVTLVFLRNS